MTHTIAQPSVDVGDHAGIEEAWWTTATRADAVVHPSVHPDDRIDCGAGKPAGGGLAGPQRDLPLAGLLAHVLCSSTSGR